MRGKRRVVILHPQDPDLLKQRLREQLGERVLDVRTCIVTEVDGYVDLKGLDLPDDLTSLILLRRFWEAHEKLETVWKRGKNEFARSLILLAAAEIKLCKGEFKTYLDLTEKAYKNVGDDPLSIALLLYLHSLFED